MLAAASFTYTLAAHEGWPESIKEIVPVVSEAHADTLKTFGGMSPVFGQPATFTSFAEQKSVYKIFTPYVGKVLRGVRASWFLHAVILNKIDKRSLEVHLYPAPELEKLLDKVRPMVFIEVS